MASAELSHSIDTPVPLLIRSREKITYPSRFRLYQNDQDTTGQSLRTGDSITIIDDPDLSIRLYVGDESAMLASVRRDKGGVDPIAIGMQFALARDARGVSPRVTHHWVMETTGQKGRFLEPTQYSAVDPKDHNGLFVPQIPGLHFDSQDFTRLFLPHGMRIECMKQ